MSSLPTLIAPCFSKELCGSVREKGSLKGYEGTLVSLAWHPDGHQLIGASEDGRLWLWDDLSHSEVRFHRKITKSSITDIGWSVDGRLLACSTQEGVVAICDARTLKSKRVEVIARGALTRIAWAPDSTRLAVAGSDWKVYIIESVLDTEPWNVQTGIGHFSGVRSVTWSDDGTMIFSGTDNGVIGVWKDSRVDNQLRHFLPGPDPRSHESAIVDLAWSPQGNILASLSDDGVIRFWDVSQFAPVGSVNCGEPAFKVDFSSDGRIVIARALHKLCFIDYEQMREILPLPCPAHLDSGIMAVNRVFQQIATDNARNHCIEIRQVDFNALFLHARTLKQKYRCAKVVVLGGTGAGKTSLVKSLIKESLTEQAQEHELEVHHLHHEELPPDAEGTSEIHELVLWDLPNHSDRELLQDLWLSDAAVILFVFDWRLIPGTLPDFSRSTLAQRGSGIQSAKVPLPQLFVVGMNADRAPAARDASLYSKLCQHFNTEKIYQPSTNRENFEQLRVAICNSIHWESVPDVEPAYVLDHIRRFVDEKVQKTIIETEESLYSLFLALNPSLESSCSPSVFRVGLEALEKLGKVHRFPLSGLILLKSVYFGRYTAALARAARHDKEGIGRLRIEDMQQGQKLEVLRDGRSDPVQEKRLFNAIVSDLVERKFAHQIATNNGTILILPTQCKREFLKPPSEDKSAVRVRFKGDIQAAYASLVVRLIALPAFFSDSQLYENAAVFKAASGGKCGIFFKPNPDIQTGEISTFFDDEPTPLTRQIFGKIVKDHLESNTQECLWEDNSSYTEPIEHEGGAARVFICYEPSDFQNVIQIALDLESRKVRCWLAGQQLDPGDKREKKFSAMREHNVVVFALREGRLSKSLQNDLQFFKKRSCRIIPIILPGASRQFNMPSGLSDYIPVDFRQLGRAPFDDLAKGIFAAQRIQQQGPDKESSMSEQIFLSYCHDDLAAAQELREELVAAGVSVWWDKLIKPGENWKVAIRSAMRKAYAIVICLSSNTAERYRSGVYKELDDAIEIYADLSPGSKFLFPVLLSDCELPQVFLGGSKWLSDIQFIKLFGPNRKGSFQDLLEALEDARYQRQRIAAR